MMGRRSLGPCRAGGTPAPPSRERIEWSWNRSQPGGRHPMFDDLFRRLGIEAVNRGVSLEGESGSASGPVVRSTNPATGQPLPAVRSATVAEYDRIVDRACAAFRTWRMVPPPQRGEVVRQIGS